MINNQWQCCQSCHRDRELRLSEKRLYSSFQFSSSVCYCNCHKTCYWEKAEFLIKAPLWLNMNKSKLYSCSFHPHSWHSQVTEVKTRALSLCNSPQRPRAVQKRRCFMFLLQHSDVSLFVLQYDDVSLSWHYYDIVGHCIEKTNKTIFYGYSSNFTLIY